MLTLLAALALAAAPRSAQKPPPVVCAAVLTPPVAVTLKNERGLVLADASAPLFAPQREAEIRVRRADQGRYTVSVQRQGYRSVTLRRVRVEVNECGPVEPTPPTIRLTPVPNAPTVRRFVVLGPRDLRVDSWPFSQRYPAVVDAPAGQREEVWSSNPDVATVDQTGMLRSVCSREGGWTRYGRRRDGVPARQGGPLIRPG
ncbi:Ig domain-containing protein [uncultured Deinococcus sp.]|uniref:Ig-like domain-containing protein n=1 Tax=uncultured Deinococcus sp. TaxID=158789 RepID=UPI0037494902